MARYFIEVYYKGTRYAGFQVQQNANTIQAEVTRALQTYFRQTFQLTGSSRTDAGVHARQNFFHVDLETEIDSAKLSGAAYHLNAILPDDIGIRAIIRVTDDAHCRFDAISRTYIYSIYQAKDPFLVDRAYFYPYQLDIEALNSAAKLLMDHHDFKSFAKKHNQSFTNQCDIYKSEWCMNENMLQYTVKANRFLRGMVRGLVGTMLQVGRGKAPAAFEHIITAGDATRANFAVPAHGLMLHKVKFPSADILSI